MENQISREIAEAIEERSAGELTEAEISTVVRSSSEPAAENRRACLIYLILPAIFLTVTLLGGLRLSATDSSFIFLKPPLVCLIFAAILMVLFARARLIRLDGWFSEELPMLANLSNGVVLAAVFAASAQVFNSLIPEQGIPYWIVGFCFFWTLWNNLFADFDTRRLIRSLGALFGLAFVIKYLVLLNLAAPANQGWIESILQSPSKTAASWLLDVPRFSAGTGYIQFFVLALYLLGIYLLPPGPQRTDRLVKP